MIDKYLDFIQELLGGSGPYAFIAGQKVTGGHMETPDNFDHVNGDMIFRWLVEDNGNAYLPNTWKPVPGDHRIWYLCIGAKGGGITYKNYETKKRIDVEWGLSGANKKQIPKVKRVIELMYKDKVFHSKQYKILVDFIKETSKIESEYVIVDYIIKKYKGKTPKIKV